MNKISKIKIGVFAGIIVIVLIIVVSRVLPNNLFQGFLAPQNINSSIEDLTKLNLEEKSEEGDTTTNPILLEPVQIQTISIPPKLSFAYLDRVDSKNPVIYGNVSISAHQYALIFRLRNTGTESAFLKSFDTTHSFSDFRCVRSDGYCRLLLSEGGSLERLNFDSNGNFINSTYIGKDIGQTGLSDGYFDAGELQNKEALEIKGGTDAVFAVYKDMSGFTWFSDYKDVQAQAILLGPSLNITDAKGNTISPSNITTDSDSATPGRFIYR